MADHGIADQGDAACAGGCRQRDRRTVEIRRGVASALALVAVVARWTAAVHAG